MAAKLSEGAVSAVNSAPGGGNKIVSAVQGAIPHVVYWSKVTAELGKQVYKSQQMSPPSLEAIQKFYAPVTDVLLKPATWWGQIQTIRPRISALPDPETAWNSLRTVPAKDLAQYSVWALEFLGFFTVGTMIGRRKIVGYRGGVKEHH
ncbi:hypothetical protein ABW19_dt0204619 [Dactylella cylindrospora]|nr:hypothetical protein ABW19_dt0204619 [Dactylella cylindrospora]